MFATGTFGLPTLWKFLKMWQAPSPIFVLVRPKRLSCSDLVPAATWNPVTQTLNQLRVHSLEDVVDQNYGQDGDIQDNRVFVA